MSDGKKRYFKKRDGSFSAEMEAEEKRLDQPMFEVKNKEFPHIFRFITARLSGRMLWTGAMTVVYACIVFFLLIQLNLFFPRPQHVSLFSDDLVNSPLSYRAHLLYLESLTVKNRLEEAQHESDFLYVSRNILNPSEDELKNLGQLQESISARKIVFHTTIDDYNHWSEVLQSHPDYRDVSYLLGQKSYMLFDDRRAKSYIQESVNLDPQFTQGKKVLQMLQR